jgi:hypothetical protein
MLLLDLAQRNVDKGPKGLSKIPAALRKLGRYAEGGEVTDPEAALFAGRGDVPAKPNMTGRELAQQALYGAGDLPYVMAGAPVDLAAMVMAPFGYKDDKPFMGSADIKARMTRAGIRPPDTTEPRLQGPRMASEMLASLTNPAAVARKVGPVVEKGVKAGAMEVGRQLDRAIMDNAGPLAKVVPQSAKPLYATAPQGPAKTPAPASELGFYSAAEQAALNLPRKEGTGAAFLNDLMKAPDVKKEELAAMGLDEFLKGKPKATRQEVQDFIANNRLDVKEVQLGGKRDFANLSDDQLQKEYVRVRGYKPVDTYGDLMSREEIVYELSGVPAADLTKFSQYQLRGGDNYREILLTIPGKKPQPVTSADDPRVRIEGSEKQGWQVVVNDGTKDQYVQSYKSGTKESEVRNYAIADANTVFDKQAKMGQYKSPHFSEPNILAHLRVNDRVDAEGKKMLLIEELQSDWHQAGRDKGYGKVQRNEYEVVQENGQLMRSFRDKNEAEAFAKERGLTVNEIPFSVDTGIPDAPFKDTWHQLALKRALKYAADNGYDRVGLTTGKQQAERYNLSSQVNQIVVTPRMDAATGEKTRSVAVDLKSAGVLQLGVDKNGVVDNARGGFDNPTQFKGKPLADIIGQEMAQKIMGAERATFEGTGLNVGGEGMKKYYDEIYPGFLAKQAKKYGAQVGETSIKTQKSDPTIGYVDYFVGPGRFNTTAVLGLRADGSTAIINQNANSLQEAQQMANRYKEKHLGGGKEPVRYIDITPEMKGAVPYAKGGPVDKNTAFIKVHS